MLKDMLKEIYILILAVGLQMALNVCCATTTVPQKNFSERADVQAFIRHMKTQHQYDSQYLTRLFKETASEPKVIKAISKPYEKLPWYRYQELLVSEKRVQDGLQFWKEHESMLEKAQEQYGVPAEMIVAIIGVETSYGKNKGNFPVFQTLATLAFDYPPRSAFFKKELEEFLLLIKEQGLDPLKMTGSYAGAVGMPQFMPSSYRKYAVESGKGPIDLINNDSDAVYSVANYFKVHGWKQNGAVASPATLTATADNKASTLFNQCDPKNPKPSITLQALETKGVLPKTKEGFKNKNELASFITLERSPTAQEYWLGLNNFYVITRYNHSTHYAMAVFKLATRIKELKK